MYDQIQKKKRWYEVEIAGMEAALVERGPYFKIPGGVDFQNRRLAQLRREQAELLKNLALTGCLF